MAKRNGKAAKPKAPRSKAVAGSSFRDRITGLRRVRAGDLLANPKNWRTHPEAQRNALRGVLAEIGYADALIGRERPGGQIELLDGHLRAETTPDAEVPVLLVDLDDVEAAKFLATLDPLAAMAGADKSKLDALLRDVETGSQELAKMLTDLAEQHGIVPGGNGELEEAEESELTDDDNPESDFLAPFPWFGGKSRVARAVWKRFGDVPSYVEPFFGSGACLLNRPLPFDGVETVNDFDGLVTNFWRSVAHNPDVVAKHADWPVLENDLHARHLWLVERKDSLQAKLEGDPDHYDAKIAGWWAWGMACWIGGGFCSGQGPWRVEEVEGVRQLVHLSGAGQGVNRKLVHLSGAGQGVNRKRIALPRGYGSMPGIKKTSVEKASGGKPGRGECGLLAWMQALSERFRRVRVCCGDWTRVCGGDSGDALSHMVKSTPCAIFLDPPYADTADRDSDIYRVDSESVAHAVRDWCVKHGDDPRLRVALCGYAGEHKMPASWDCVKWKAQGGMANQGKGKTKGKANAFKERAWFSPHCIPLEKRK